MKGYNGRILRVNLTTCKYLVEEPSEDFYKRYLGGRGFIIHTLLTEVPKGIDPLGNENKLIFALGPITGCPLPGSGRNSIGAKSPLTGGFGESEVGGYWGAALKRAGYDAIIIEGNSPNPVYLWIDNGRVEIRDASRLWGLEIAATEKAIKEELADEKIRTAIIGPAGEKLVRYACIANDISHYAGRTGLGAVMGSKKLKAIALRGSRYPEIANKEGIVRLSRWMSENFKEKTTIWRVGTGTSGFMKNNAATGNLPMRNFRGGSFPNAEKISADEIAARGYLRKMDSCFVCPVRCKKRVKIDNPWVVDPIYGGPEYETMAALGSNCGVDNIEAIIKANELCGRYGIDTISTGVCISFAMECFEKGILHINDTDGLELTFGNAQAMVAMVENIALRKGLGDLLAEGVKRASEKIGEGSMEFAMHVKGMEIPMHEPRYNQAMGLHYSIHSTGPDHVTGVHDDLISKDLKSWESIDVAESLPSTELNPKKARMLYQVGLWRHLGNYLGLCHYVPWNYQQMRDATEYITGWPMSYWKLMKASERGITLTRIFNLREGFSAKQDTLPDRFTTSTHDGPLTGFNIDSRRLNEAQKIYYQMLGWDERGIPTKARLIELDIEWAYQYLEDVH
jgi:aldehyde:ferredoxin oxidoreductase